MHKICSRFYGIDEDDLEEFYDDLDDEEAGQLHFTTICANFRISQTM